MRHMRETFRPMWELGLGSARRGDGAMPGTGTAEQKGSKKKKGL